MSDTRASIERRLAFLARLDADEALRRRVLERCARDPLFFADWFAWTFDPQRSDSYSAIPFDPFEFQRAILLFILGLSPGSRLDDGQLRKIVLDKGRELGISYLVLLAFLWSWIFERGVSYGVMSRTGREVYNGTEGSLFGKLLFMLERLPGWMRPRYSFKSHPTPVLLNEETGNVIVGSSTTTGAFHGERYTRILGDEWARIQGAEFVARGVNGATRAAILVSTPNGMGNHFARLVHGLAGKVLNPDEAGPGWVHFRCSYRDDPRKDAAWVARMRAELSDQEWAEQHNVDYQASAPGRIWKHFRRDLHLYDAKTWQALEAEGWLAGATIVEGWDFGSGESLTAVVWAAYVESIDTLYLLDYRQWREADFDAVADGVGDAGWLTDKRRGRRPRYRVGDIAGKARGSDQRSWLSNLKSRGIDITGQSMAGGRIEWAIQRIDKAIRDERLFCAPAFEKRHNAALPTGVEVLEGYRRSGEQPVKDVHSHLADAIQHVALRIWPQTSQGLVEQD